MKLIKKTVFALLSCMIFSGCGDLLSLITEYETEYHNVVDATESKVWNYNQNSPIYEVTPDVLSVTINNMPKDKTLYLVKHNPSKINIKIADTRTITSTTSRSSIDDNLVGIDEANFTKPEFSHFVGQELPSLKSSSSRASAGAELKTTPAVKDYKLNDKKEIFIDIDNKMETYSKKLATLRAIGNKCYVWIVDEYYGNNTANKVNDAVAQKYALKFDEMYPVITNVFGKESESILDYDVGKFGEINNYSDTGDKVNIVIYDIAADYKNAETVSTVGVMGYFYAKDYYYTSTTQYGSNSIINKSNVGKYFYIDSGFANSNFEDTISTLAHEFQHMLNFNQKNVMHDVAPSTSYNEMLSMLCEDMMQEYLGLEDYASPKNRIQSFNAYYYMSGITEYRSDDLAALSYSTSYAFGSWLCRQYGGAELVKEIMSNDSVDNESLVAAVNNINGTTFSYEVLFKQFLMALTRHPDFTHNQDAVSNIKYIEDYPIYKYPMKAFNIFDSTKTNYKQNGEDAIYTFSLKDWIIDKSKGTKFDIQYKNYVYSGYDWNGPLLFSVGHGPSELRGMNGISIHGIEKITNSNKTYIFTSKGADTLKMYLIIQ